MMKPDLSHRYNHKEPRTPYEFRDAIDTVLGRAEAVIALIQTHMSNDASGENDTVNPEIFYFALESVVNDLKDIRSLVEAFAQSGHQA